MGFFSKIKDNLSHGGVKVSLQAPASASMADAQLPVTVSVTAGDSQAQVKSVRVEILAESQNQNFSQPTSTDPSLQQQQSPTVQIVARAEDTTAFTLAPGETRQVQLGIVLNQGAAIGAAAPQGSGLATVANTLEEVQMVGEALNPKSFTYQLKAVASLEGIMMGPSAQQPLQLLKPGQFGTAVNL